MPSPFPGMDPYLEQRWGDFHSRIVTYVADAVQQKLPADLRARMEQRVYLEQVGSAAREFIPDVAVHEIPRPRGTRPEAPEPDSGGGVAVEVEVAVAEPILIHLPLEVTERFIRIIDVRSGGRVVTVIEVLSPSNKLPGHGREEYLRKQKECVDAGVNLVEIDLLRVGRHTTLSAPSLVPPGRLAMYHTSTWRAARVGQIEYYPMPHRSRLPRLPIPLRPTDRDVVLDLQAVVDTAYDRGRYDDIDYTKSPEPPFSDDDAAWARSLLSRHAPPTSA